MCAFDAAGHLYVAESMNHCVRRVDRDTGVIVTIAGTGAEGYSGDGGPATAAAFNQPYSIQVDANGDVYVVDRLNYVIRKIDAATGIVSTVAGTGESGYGGDDGQVSGRSSGNPTTAPSTDAAGCSSPTFVTSASAASI